jgi:hypothetical protein
MPEKAGRNGAPRSPGISEGLEGRVGWDRGKLFDGLHGDFQREIAAGPDIRAAQGHQEIDIGGPGADALDLNQGPAHIVIGEVL